MTHVLVSFCNQGLNRPPLALVDLETRTVRPIELDPGGVLTCTGMTRAGNVLAVAFQASYAAGPELAFLDPSTLVMHGRAGIQRGREVHSIAWHDGTLYAASTGTDEVLRLHIDGGQVLAEDVAWRPPGATERADNHHINSVVIRDGRLYAGGFWRKTGPLWSSATNGRIVDVLTGREIVTGLPHPHSLTVIGGDLYVCASIEQMVRQVEGSRQFTVPGYARGLCTDGQRLLVGTSTGRRTSRSTGIANPADPGNAASSCGITIVDAESLAVRDFINLEHLSTEIYDLLLLDGEVRFPIMRQGVSLGMPTAMPSRTLVGAPGDTSDSVADVTQEAPHPPAPSVAHGGGGDMEACAPPARATESGGDTVGVPGDEGSGAREEGSGAGDARACPVATAPAPPGAHTAERPLVSIGVPAYNGAQHLAEALESALAQEYAPLEVIVVDDASTDDTEAIARRYAAADARVRYVRNPKNLGAVANFRHALRLARGRYFTWLAQDDVLSARTYVSTLVEYLERHPDVVACTSAFFLLDHEYPGSRSVMSFPEIGPDVPWSEARQVLYRWPQSPAHLALYSMYRREALARIPLVTRRYQGRPSSAWWEMPVLTALSGLGRIVAIPECLRDKRSSNASDGWQTYQLTSPFDLFALGLRMKLLLIRSAWQVPVSAGDRLGLLRLTFANVFRANFERPFDIGVLVDVRRRELTELQRVADERAHVIATITQAIAERRALLDGLGQGDGGRDDMTATPADGIVALAASPISPDSTLARDLARFDASRGSLLAFFRRTPGWLTTLCERLNVEIGRYRRYCAAQEEQIARLDAEARALLRTIDGADPGASVQPPPQTVAVGESGAGHQERDARPEDWSRTTMLRPEPTTTSAVRSDEQEHEALSARIAELEAQVQALQECAETLAASGSAGWARAHVLDQELARAWKHAHALDQERAQAWAHAHKLDAALSAEQARLHGTSYNADALAVWYKDVAFLRDRRFVDAYTAGMQSGHQIARPPGSTEDIHIEWRVHVICWAAQHAKQLDGSFVECGVNTGIYALAACQYIDFNALDKDFYLFDTYAGIPESQMHESERAERLKDNELSYPDCYEVAQRNFATYPRARLVRGIVPDTLTHVDIDRVCYLSLDMNIAEPEIAALEHFWPRLVSGAVVILDDYGWTRYALQKQRADAFAREKQVEILLLPTGQGLIIKP